VCGGERATCAIGKLLGPVRRPSKQASGGGNPGPKNYQNNK
jgi:hypothetical protein